MPRRTTGTGRTTRGPHPSTRGEVEGNYYRAGLAIPANNSWVREARRCVDYLEGRQYDYEEIERRKAALRPVGVYNHIAPLYKLLYGWMIQQKMDITYRPGNAWTVNDDTAEVLTRLIKTIHTANDFEFVQTEMFLAGISSGRGWADARADFSQNFMGEIKITTRDEFMTFPDPEAWSYDPKDWGYIVETRWMSLDDILVYYGKKARQLVERKGDLALDARYEDSYWLDVDFGPETYFGMLEGNERAEDKATYYAYGAQALDAYDPQRDLVRVIDCQWKKLARRRRMVDLESGDYSYIPESWPREKIDAILKWSAMVGEETGQGQTIAVEEGMYPMWMWTVTAGDQLLYEAPSLYERPTQVLFAPYFRKGITRGLIHDLLDPQDEINRRRNAVIEIIGRIANGGWIYERGSLDDVQKANLEDHGATPGVHVEYNQGKAPPQPLQPSQIPGGHTNLELLAKQDLKDISNINDVLLGNVDVKDQSGRALMTRQKGGLTALGMYGDQLKRSLMILGRAEHDIVKKIYTEQRIFRERGDDSTDTPYVINRRMADGRIVNDVTCGTYDVTVDVSPYNSTFQIAAFETMLEMRDKGIPIPPPEIVRAAPIPDKRRIADEVQLAVQAQQAAAANGQPIGSVKPGSRQPPMMPKGGAGAGAPAVRPPG